MSGRLALVPVEKVESGERAAPAMDLERRRRGLAMTAVASAEVRGRASRRFFDPPPECASDGQRAAARRFAESIGAGFVEVEQ